MLPLNNAFVNHQLYIVRLMFLLISLILFTACTSPQTRPTWREVLIEADHAAQQEDAQSVLIRMEYRLLFGDYHRWSYQYNYVSSTPKSIVLRFDANSLEQPSKSVFPEGEELSLASYKEWQEAEELLRQVTTEPEEIIKITEIEAQKKDKGFRVGTVTLTAHPEYKRRTGISPIWLVTYLNDSTRDAIMYIVNANTREIIDVLD